MCVPNFVEILRSIFQLFQFLPMFAPFPIRFNGNTLYPIIPLKMEIFKNQKNYNRGILKQIFEWNLDPSGPTV